VLKIVTDLGLLTKKGNRLSGQTFSQMLRNPIYVGVLHIPKWDVHASEPGDI